MNAAPLGVFDSGIGGLTVARALFERLPRESVIYFGDTARVPYGPKSPDTVRRYSGEILAYLLGRGVKAVVVACNTSTAHALPHLQANSPVPVVGVLAILQIVLWQGWQARALLSWTTVAARPLRGAQR